VTGSGGGGGPVRAAEAVGRVVEVGGGGLVRVEIGCGTSGRVLRLLVVVVVVGVRCRRQSTVRLAVEVAQRVRFGMHHHRCRRAIADRRQYFIIISQLPDQRATTAGAVLPKYIGRRKSATGGGGTGHWPAAWAGWRRRPDRRVPARRSARPACVWPRSGRLA